MPSSDTNGAKRTDRSIVDKLWGKRAELLWGLVAVIMLLAFFSPAMLIGAALVIATVAAAWLGFHELMDRAKTDDAQAPADPLRPADAGQRGTEKPPTPAPWEGHHAA